MKANRRSLVILSSTALLLVILAWKLDVRATGENVYEQIQRFMEVMQTVSKLYVEDVDAGKMVDGAIRGMLEELDPHSVYIPKESLQEINEQFEGEFEGIGIEFIINNKLPTVVSPIVDSPSERLGLRPGDRITKIEGVSTYGFAEDQVRQKLLGPKGTKVTIEILRPGFDEPFSVTITRDKIPVYSVSAAFMIDRGTGLIKVGRFARTTNEEFVKALTDLKAQGLKRLLLDLRGNTGGYLDQAVEMADHFLGDGKRIVYTRGRIPNSSEDYFATADGSYEQTPLVVLIDHGSASAAEIVAGAVQDWDRGLIVGVTSFGKGLVQQQIPLKDGSALRVTIARYYTPSGRLIQRPYEHGLADYVSAGLDDIDPNAVSDSSFEKPMFMTSGGRKVYGGGGISPDVNVKPEAITLTSLKLIQQQLLFEYGSSYSTLHRELARDFGTFRDRFQVGEEMVNELTKLARSRGIEVVAEHITQDVEFIKRRIKSQIARNIWGTREYYQIEALGDRQVTESRKLFDRAAKIAGLKLEG
ncbi:MAG TPA: S41 family peptidase [bacterium]